MSDVVQRRDNWSKDQIRSLRRRVRNLRSELAIQAGAYRDYRKRHRGEFGGYRRGRMESDVKVRRIEDTLSLMAQQQAWYRDRFAYIAQLVRSEDWQARAKESPESYFSAIAWLAEDATRQPKYPAPPATGPAEGASGC